MKKNTNKSITVAELAAFSNLTTRRIRQLSEEAKITPIKRGKLEMPAALKMLFAHYQKVSEEMSAERLALVKANRETKQMELAKAQGKYIDRDVAYQKCVAALMKLKSFVREEIELRPISERREKLREFGVSEEIAARFFTWDTQREITVITAIENRCEDETKQPDAISF